MSKLLTNYRAWVSVTLLPAVLSCATSPGGCDPVAESVRIDPGELVLAALGATGQLEATALGADECVIENPGIEWATNDPAVATVDANGLVTAVGNGTANITASAAGQSRAATVTVQQAAASMESVAGDGQTGLLNGAVDVAPSVVIRDANDNLAEGVTVDFVVTAGGGEVEGGEATTTADGIATVGAWILGPEIGTDNNTLEARADGATAVTFTASGELGAPVGLAIFSGNEQDATVGTAVPDAPTAKVQDAAGNGIAGHTVTFEVIQGAGEITGETAVTDDDGLAAVGSWTLGTVAGENNNQLRATAEGFDPVNFLASGRPDAPASAAVNAGDAQTAQVNTAVDVPPSVVVRDQHENLVPDVAVTFAVTAGGGTALEGTVQTDDEGVATVGSWTLGTVSGDENNQLTASITGLDDIVFTASAAAGDPATMEMGVGDGQTATVNMPVAIAPSVTIEDEFGNPVPEFAVFFDVDAGGGSLTGDEPLTDENGVATVGSWTLGTNASVNQVLAARVEGISTVIRFTATATPGPPTVLEKSMGDGQSGVVGAPLSIAPAVTVRDEFENPVPDISVTFTPAAGSGSVIGSPATSDAFGVATLGSWSLGMNGANTLTATADNATPAVFEGTGVISLFNIELRYMEGTNPTQAQMDLFQSAVDRWRAVITEELVDVSVNVAADQCFNLPAVNETVDDVIVYVQFTGIDGEFSTLATGGTCWVRIGDEDNFLPILGRIRVDTDDLDRLENNGDLEKVLIHEFGHVLGIGTLWDELGFLADSGLADPYYTGAGGLAAFDEVGGTTYVAGPKVPVANTGGSGTRDTHWRESVFQEESMTGFIDAGPNPLSVVTVAALGDFGYSVNLEGADPYVLPGSTLAIPPLVGTKLWVGADADIGPLYGVDRYGRVTRIR